MVSGTDLFLNLFNNLAIFIVLVAVYGFLINHFDKVKPTRQIILGLCFGLFTIICMNVKIPVAKGVIVDQRNAIITLSAVFGGPFSVMITAIMAAAYRISLGGAGVLAGVIGVCLSALAGTILFYLKDKIDSILKSIIGAIFATILILPGFIFVGDFHSGWELMMRMALPYGSAIFIGMLFVGLLLHHEENRNLAVKKLKDSEKRYRGLFENLIDVSYMTDMDGTILMVSPSAEIVFGFHPDELIGRKIGQFYINHSDRTDFLNKIERAGYVENFEAQILKKDGGHAWVSTNAKLSLDDTGAVIGVEGITRDITQQKMSEEEKSNLEEQLRQSQKMEAVGTLAGGIAHDFNNILTVILGYAELALRGAQDKENHLKGVKEILKAGNRAKELVTQILTFSRKFEPKLKPTDLNSIIKQTEKMLERTIPKMIAIEHELCDDLSLVNADNGQMYQIFMNLCSNASDAMPEGGRLIIETENVSLDEIYKKKHVNVSEGEYVQITVSDTGHGMDKETLMHIFEPFFTKKKEGKGTGLGLATVYGIVKSHGGHIMCYSEIGQGTSFKIYLPALRSVEKAEVPLDPLMDFDQGGSEAILVIDDEVSIRELIEEVLGESGYRTSGAKNGEEAIEIYMERQDEIDMVILDLNMPGMGGYKCLEKLLEINPSVKVIISSGYSKKGQLADVVYSGASGYLPKPFNRSMILKSVREALDKR